MKSFVCLFVCLFNIKRERARSRHRDRKRGVRGRAVKVKHDIIRLQEISITLISGGRRPGLLSVANVETSFTDE